MERVSALVEDPQDGPIRIFFSYLPQPTKLDTLHPYEQINTKRGCPMKKSAENKNQKATNKGDLVASISKLSNLSKATSTIVLEHFLYSIQQGLKAGEEVRIKELGTFRVIKRKAGMGRNPRTGEPLKIKAANLPKFRASKTLKEAIS